MEQIPLSSREQQQMQIYGPFRLSTAQGPTSAQSASSAQKANRFATDAATTKPSASPVDQLDLSSAAQTSASTGANRLDGASSIAGGGEIRIDRVAELRRQISDGNYETPEKLDAALDRLLDDLV